MRFRSNPIRRDSVTTRAAQEICRYIAEEKLNPGDILPTESTLSRLLGISRNSVREALRIVHGLGMIDKIAGKRVTVTSGAAGGRSVLDEQVMREAASTANTVRSQIAQRCAELAAERLTPAELEQLDERFATLERAVLNHDAVNAQQAHDAFHGLLLSGSRNPLLVAMFNQAQLARLSNVLSAAQQSYTDPRHLGQHRALLQAMHRHDARSASAVVRAHYESLGSMLKVGTADRREKKATRPTNQKLAPDQGEPERTSTTKRRRRC